MVAEQEQRAGLVYGIAAFGLWGVFPIYFRALQGVPPWKSSPIAFSGVCSV